MDTIFDREEFKGYHVKSYNTRQYVIDVIFSTLFMDQEVTISIGYTDIIINVIDKSSPKYVILKLIKIKNVDDTVFRLKQSSGIRYKTNQYITIKEICKIFDIKDLEDKIELINQRFAFENY